MVPVSATVAMSHLEGISDSARARELYKYYQPNITTYADPTEAYKALPEDAESYNRLNITSNVASTKISSPDTALTAFAQLVSWRTGAQRAMISVIDEETQYFIAESTKTIDLVDNSKFSAGDELWIGCGEVAKAGRLCERTIELPPAPAGEYPAFIVDDLSKDERFNQLPFVSGPPFLKFYAGTPLITKSGIPIGSLFIVDERPQLGVSKDDIHFMGTMAATIMRHMEMVREVEEHRRGMKMSRGLASFVEGRSELMEAEVEGEDEGTAVAGQFETAAKLHIGADVASRSTSIVGSVSSVDRKEKEYSSALLKTEEAIMTASPMESLILPSTDLLDASTQSQRNSFDSLMSVTSPAEGSEKITGLPVGIEESEASAMKRLFARAANLIREAFEVDGGSVFYDAQKGFGSEFTEEEVANHYTDADFPDSGDTSEPVISASNIESKDFASPDTRTDKSAFTPSRSGTFARFSIKAEKVVEILAFSTPAASSFHGDELPGTTVFAQPDEKSLHALLKRYPRGKLWTFVDDGSVSSSSDDDKQDHLAISTAVDPRSRHVRHRKARSLAESKLLLGLFPGVRQLLFVPLWDASRSRWLSANFTWTNEPTRVLSKQSELSFLTAFGNSVMAECSRIDTEIADQKKGDFIGSISHELRSPLHGILASAEFLSEEITEGFAKGLVETVDSCGRTLLDTINHILDFSKINHFEKNWRKSRRPLGPSRNGIGITGPLALRQADIPMINLFADVDISIVCEEVVEGVFAGHAFQNMTASSFDMVPDARGKMSDPKKYVSTADPAITVEQSHHADVAVILDIDVQNYQFTTQPGAFRRVIMNLLGNAMKYTSRGYVKIRLEATEVEDFHPPGTSELIPRSCVTLTITDTGKGISREFIRSKLFTPFAQENSLSSGTGLGLSIVRSIVALLEGEIQIKSELGRGTEVKVTLPLLRELPKDKSSGSTPKSVPSVPKEASEVIDQLRTRIVGKTAALHGFDREIEDPLQHQTVQLLKSSVSNFLTAWYGLIIVPAGEKADVIVVDETDATIIANLARPRPGYRRGPMVLALCSNSSRYDRAHAAATHATNVGFLAKPIGPLKMARALGQLLDGLPVTSTPGLVQNSSGSGARSPNLNDLSNVFEDLSMSPHGGEVLDSGRMAAGSHNARKALESPLPNVGSEKHQEFPFPSDRPIVPKAKSMPADQENLVRLGVSEMANQATVALTEIEKPKDSQPEDNIFLAQPPSMARPRLLLVDDNKINLRLLRTYMRRRRYNCIDEAENGLEAVHAARHRVDGYDIIFMDISMPILDGFGATRQIRQLERVRHDLAVQENQPPKTPALIIALTGLASSRDQSEAFTSGVDLFLTKPVAFKEVGKMLENWEANREHEIESSPGENMTTKVVTIKEPNKEDMGYAKQ